MRRLHLGTLENAERLETRRDCMLLLAETRIKVNQTQSRNRKRTYVLIIDVDLEKNIISKKNRNKSHCGDKSGGCVQRRNIIAFFSGQGWGT